MNPEPLRTLVIAVIGLPLLTAFFLWGLVALIWPQRLSMVERGRTEPDSTEAPNQPPPRTTKYVIAGILAIVLSVVGFATIVGALLDVTQPR